MIIHHRFFENFIIGLIILNSLKLILDTYLNPGKTNTKPIITYISNYIDLIFTIIFALESALKSITFGFFISKDAYLRETWN